MYRCLLIPVTGEPTLHMAGGLGLEDPYRLIGKTCECIQTLYLNVPTCDALPIFMDEEGKLKNLQFNSRATELCREFGAGLSPGDIIVGNVLVTGPLDKKGNYANITDEQVFRLCRQVKAIVPGQPE